MLPRQSRRILMRALAEAAFHAGCKTYARFPKFVPQVICRRKRLLPAMPLFSFEQVLLPTRARLKR